MRMLKDLTQTEPIYQACLRTVCIKIRRPFIASEEVQLLTVAQPGTAHSLHPALFASTVSA